MCQDKEPTGKERNSKAKIVILSAMQKHDRAMSDIRAFKEKQERTL